MYQFYASFSPHTVYMQIADDMVKPNQKQKSMYQNLIDDHILFYFFFFVFFSDSNLNSLIYFIIFHHNFRTKICIAVMKYN